MQSKKYLVVGGSGEAGQSAIEYLKKSDPNCLIISSTSENSNIPGADAILSNIKADEEMADKIQTQLEIKLLASDFEAIIYTPALGEVGYPIRNSKVEDIEKALGISYYPMLDLEARFSPKYTIGYSAFYWLPHTLAFYGTMGYVKLKMDEWAIASPQNRKIIRAGTFFSKSLRGISIVLQRTMKTNTDPDLLKLKDAFVASGQKFQDFFLEYAWKNEKDFFSNPSFKSEYRATKREDLSRGLGLALQAEEPIVTVLGDWDWKEKELPKMPDWFRSEVE
jgi:hypothetical protein